MARALPQPDAPMTADEFIRFSNARPDGERWELYDGVPVLNASAIDYHQIIVGNLTHYLDTVADERQPDWVAMPGFGVLIQGPRGDSVPTPDVIVRSAIGLGKPYCSDPIVLFEVLSPDSGKRDLEIKRELYLRLPTVRHYVVIAVKAVEITVFDGGGGEPRCLRDLALSLDLPALGVAIPLAFVYRRTPRALDASR